MLSVCVYTSQMYVHKTSAHFNAVNFHTGRLSQKPRLMDVVDRLVPHLGIEIHLLAIQLGLKMEEIEIIKHENPANIQSQTLEVLYLWLRKDEGCTWAFLIEALRSPTIKEYRLARNIEDWLSKGNITTIIHHDKNTL